MSITGNLAKLSDLKILFDSTSTEMDAALLPFLDWATSAAERIAGRLLTRVQNYTFYNSTTTHGRKLLRVGRFPIESIDTVVDLGFTGTDAQFTAATALVENTDYVAHIERGTLERIHGCWSRFPRSVRVAYTGGYVDPARIEVALATATWTAATKTLTQVGAFVSYAHVPGDVIVINGGTGATVGTYRVASKTDDDSIVLETSLSATDLATGDITSGYSGMVLPPVDLQKGVLDEAQRMWNHKGAAGLTGANFGQGGSVDLTAGQPAESLVAAAERLIFAL